MHQDPARNPLAEARAVVEDAQAYLETRGSIVVEDLGDVVVRHVPFSPAHWFGAATRPRFGDVNAGDRIDVVRRWFRDHGRTDFMWMVGESATPADLVTRLLDKGAELDQDDPVAEAMILDHEPPAGPPDIDTRRIETFEEFRKSCWITLAEAPAEVWATTEANLETAWAEISGGQHMYSFMAFIAGQPIANAQLVWLSNGLPYLGGASTLREYRGRGAFTALVRARWDDAAAHGVPILLVQAGRLSEPILRRLGFESTGKITVLHDRSTVRS